jgi:hypothetical protein
LGIVARGFHSVAGEGVIVQSSLAFEPWPYSPGCGSIVLLITRFVPSPKTPSILRCFWLPFFGIIIQEML